MANQFGALTDHFGFATSDLVLVESSATPVARSVERATDANGDNVEQETHGQTTAGTLAEASCKYALKSGTLNLNTLACGFIAETDAIAQQIEAATSKDEWPTITVSGPIEVITPIAPATFANTFTLPSITLTGAKRAQLLGFTIGETCRLNASTLTASIEVGSQADGVGVVVAHGLSGGVVAVTAQLVAISGVASWTVPAGYDETQAPGSEQGQAAWHTTSAAAEIILVRDAAA